VHKDIPALTAALLPSIENRDNQETFVRAVTGAGMGTLRTRAAGGDSVPAGLGPETPLPAAATNEAPLTPAELEHATRVLTQYIGPIARVVVKRAAAGGASRRDFFQQVTQSLDTDAKRESFLREATIPGV
jgi:serine/threonine-protein kinase